MKLRLAEMSDLPALEMMFTDIVASMNKNGLYIWNAYYPYEAFAGDIENSNLYVIPHQNGLAAAFGVYKTVAGQDCFAWKDTKANALYLGRLGVNSHLTGQGFGSAALQQAKNIAKHSGADFLRLLVTEDNAPAIALYRRNRFTQAAGSFHEHSPSLGKTLIEIGFEIGV